MNNRTLAILILGLLGFAQGQGNGFCNLVWSDEFNGNAVSSQWEKEQTCYGGGNNEMQCYTARDKNIYIDNGNLVLRAYRERYTGSRNGCTDVQGCDWTKDYTSGRVNTRRSVGWTYGRFETRARIPSGYQLWPAIWMMPMDYRYGGWAASGEIDIMEARGQNPWVASGTLHHGGQWPQNTWTSIGDHGVGVDLSQDFHVYTLEWTPDYMKWYIDANLTGTISMRQWFSSSARGVYNAPGQPFDQRFHFILNLAVGGAFFSDPAVTPAQADAWRQPEMRVDYVRVWQQGGNCAATPAPSETPRPTQTPAPTPSQAPDNNARPGQCNGQGYDSKLYTCTMNEVNQQVLCQSGQASCGKACYSPSSYCCMDGGLRQKNQCPNTPVPTRTSTSTSTSKTQAPATTANPTPGLCNGQRYDSNAYTCATNEQGRNILCPKNNNSCGNACFNPELYCCKNGNLRQKGQC